MNHWRDRNLLLTTYFIFYYTIFLFYFADHRLLSQYQPVFFNYNRDLTELALIGTGIPHFLMTHLWALQLADALVLLLPAALLIRVIRQGRFSIPLGIAFSGYFAFYLLLANIFWQVDHEPFLLYVLLSTVFLTNRSDRFYQLLRACRYYFLYIFVSAALWKIARGAVFNGAEMSRILLVHHSDLLSGPCLSLQCRGYTWLIDHPAVSWWLYFGGVVLELSFAVGFFTRRWDRLLIAAAVLFVAADMLVMRIPYWIILMGAITLYIGSRRSRAKRSGIVIYETTHHENLPAMLDLSEASFEKVAVFLKAFSYDNISGHYDPREKWPKTEFFIQPDGANNRVFIRQLFRYVRRSSYSHLHFNTLDNNLPVFVLELAALRDVHVSMTIHAVNDYFSFSARSLKGLLNSLANYFLRRQVRFYTFYLPAMAEKFGRLLPGATAVSIPSRFYPVRPVITRSSADSGPLRIVIPGSVDPNRRDYEEVAGFLRDYLSRRSPLSKPLELVILGDSDTAYGAKVLPEFRALESADFRLVTYTGYIPESSYEDQLSAADLVWSPLRTQKTSPARGPEIYGLTIASGLTADLQLGCAPVLVPAWLQLPAPFQAAVLPYASSAELNAHFDQWLHDAGYRDRLREKIDTAFTEVLQKENFYVAFRSLMGLPPGPSTSAGSES